ncbi:MAG: hypothetical protein A2Y56_14230 [Candidatus Aminicenantes bacterium RBG_13_63_10]|nr:MAG: hypothetical protein A2Y56_14230 [Candidatus Aminicenantes bacterium RBG_13_63_10]
MASISRRISPPGQGHQNLLLPEALEGGGEPFGSAAVAVKSDKQGVSPVIVVPSRELEQNLLGISSADREDQVAAGDGFSGALSKRSA